MRRSTLALLASLLLASGCASASPSTVATKGTGSSARANGTSSQAVRSGIIYLEEDRTAAIQQGSTTYDVPDTFALPDGTSASTKKVTDVSADQSSKNVFALAVSEEDDSCAPHLIKWDAADGNATYLGEGFLPEFSPDGKFVLYVGRARTDTRECGQTGLILADASTGAIVRRWTTTTEQRDIIQSRPQWAPDGTQVAVSLTSSELAILPAAPAGSDVSLREAARLYDSPTHGLQRPVWVSNGLYVLLVGSEATYLKTFDPSTGKYGQNFIKDPVGDVIAADPKGNLLVFQGEESGYPSGRVFFYSDADQVLTPLDPLAGNPVDLTDW